MPTTNSVKARLRAAREQRLKVKSKDQKSMVDKSDSIVWDALHPYGPMALCSPSKPPPGSPDRSLSTASTAYSDSPSQSGRSWYHHGQRGSQSQHSYSVSNTCTRLCELLWTRQWEKVQAELLQQHNKPQSLLSQQWSPLPCFSNGAAGLPLHLACAMRPLPPYSVIEALLEDHPQAAHQKASMWGLLPLHLAVDLRGTASGTSNSDKTDTGMTSLALSTGNDNDNEDNLSSLGSTATASSYTPSLLHELVDDESEDNRAISKVSEEEMTNHCRIIRLLLNAYPMALIISEEFQGMVPLHIAVSTTPTQGGKVPPNSAQVLQLLLENSPETFALRDHAGDTPVIMAQRSGKQQLMQHHAAPKKMGGSTATITRPPQIIVSHLPDWKWNPILYPTARNDEGATIKNDKNSDLLLLGRHNISSLLVSSLDDLMNLSTSSESGSDHFLREYDLYGANSSDDSDTARNSAIIATSSSSDSDDDSIHYELQQLEFYQAELRRELEESIRLHCYSNSPTNIPLAPKEATDIKLEKYDNENDDDKHVPILVMTTSEDTTAALSLSNDDYQSATGLTAGEILESTATVSLEETINRIHRIMNEPVSKEGFHACEDDGIDSASFDQELERLETFESNLRQELESAKSFASFLKYSFDNQNENNRGNNRCFLFEDQVEGPFLTAQPEDSANKEAKEDIDENDNGTAVDYRVMDPILAGNTEKVVDEGGEGTSEVSEFGSRGKPPLHQDEECERKHDEEVLPPSYVDSISEKALAEPPAVAVAMRVPVKDQDNLLQIGQSHFNEDNSRKQAFLSAVSLPLSFLLSDQVSSSSIGESDTWDDIPLSEADTFEQSNEEDASCVETLEGTRQPKIEPSLLEKPTQGRSIFNKGATGFSCQSFPSKFYGLPAIQESQSLSEVDDAGDHDNVDENLTTEREASFVSENEMDAKATDKVALNDLVEKDAATRDNLDFDTLDHDLQHPSNSNTEAVLAEGGDVVIVWKRMTSSKPRFPATAGQGHKTCHVDKSESPQTSCTKEMRDINESYISWQRVMPSTIKRALQANPRVPSSRRCRDTTDPPLISWARVPSTDSIHFEWKTKVVGNICSRNGAQHETHPTSGTTDDDCQTAVVLKNRGSQNEKLLRKDIIRCSPQGNLTQLTDQLQRLQAENRSQIQEMERLKRRLSIITEIKGVHYDDLRKALQDMCEKDKMTSNAATPATSSISVADVLDGWYQELKLEQAEISIFTNMPDCLLQTASSLSQPHSSNDRKWMNNTNADGYPVPTYMPPPEPRGPPMVDVADEVFNKSDLGSNFSDWYKELLDESGCRDTQTPLNVNMNKTDNSLVGLEISLSDVAVPDMHGNVTRQDISQDESCSSILGLKIERDDDTCSQHLPNKEKEVVLTPENHPEHATSKTSVESQKRRHRLRELVRSRKSLRPFLDAKEVAKKLFPPNVLDNPSKIYQLDLLDQTFEDIWRTGLPPCSSSNRVIPTCNTIPPIIICDPRSLIASSKTCVLSGPVEDIVDDLLEGEGPHQSKVPSSFDWLPSVENTKVNMGKRTKITVVEKASKEGITEPGAQSYCTNNEPPPVAGTGCCGMRFGDLWASIEATDGALASVEQLASQAHDSFEHIFGCNNASSSFGMQGPKEATSQKEHEQLMSCKAWLHKERQNLDKNQVSPGIVTSMDQLLSDVEKTVSDLSQYIQTLSRCNAVEQRNDASKKAKHNNRRPSSSSGTNWSLRRSGWL